MLTVFYSRKQSIMLAIEIPDKISAEDPKWV